MSVYLIGDIQGCDDALGRLLAAVDFSPSRDTIYLLGDLVNRGPESAAVLRRLMRLDDAARCVLGNHDMHLLAVAYGIRRPHRHDTLDEILAAGDRRPMLDWLRRQHLALRETIAGHDILMVHAGVLPQWSAERTLELANELETVLRSAHIESFLHEMYGDTPDRWSDNLQGNARLRVVINALTRLRFCTAEGQMEFKTKEGAGGAPDGYMPWFDVPGRKSSSALVAFGHWSTLGWLAREDVVCLDTGCVWGGPLSALRAGPASEGALGSRQALIQVPCPQAQKPGA